VLTGGLLAVEGSGSADETEEGVQFLALGASFAGTNGLVVVGGNPAKRDERGGRAQGDEGGEPTDGSVAGDPPGPDGYFAE
jgi:hypothetical protein